MRALAELPAAPEWQGRANCQQTDPEVFYPGEGGSPRQAKRVCDRCEVQDECLEYALDRDERFGVWGGKSETERRKLRRARRATELEVAA